jgi:hypothetical protein
MNRSIKKIINELVDDKLFYFSLLIVITVTTILNWNANLMEGILPYYNNFTNYFINGFKYNGNELKNVYTWPMWGYGLVLLLKSKIIIIIVQQLLTSLVIIIVRSYLKNKIDIKSYKIFSLFILCATPWYFFQVSLWPYGISANLLTLSLLALTIGIEKSKFKYVLISALCFGMMLNFRSDYFYLAFILGIAIIIFNFFLKFSDKATVYIFLWLSIITLTLLPWALHSYKYSNKFSFVSSNAGHVFYISLGQLPENKWNITPSDEDSSMRKLINSSFSVKESTLTTRSNKLLMSRFVELIKNDPKEYFKKCLYNLKSFTINPFYLGSVYSKRNNINEFNSHFKTEIGNNNYFNAFKLLFHEYGFYVFFIFFSYIISQIVLIFAILSSYNYIRLFRKTYKLKLLQFIILIVFSYQIALSVFAYHLSIYSTNIFLLLIILIVISFNNKKVLN